MLVSDYTYILMLIALKKHKLNTLNTRESEHFFRDFRLDRSDVESF